MLCRSPCGERGLKCVDAWAVSETVDSRSPCGERGLKSIANGILSDVTKSLPVRGAWIEIKTRYPWTALTEASLPVRGAWIEIKEATAVYINEEVAPRAGSVD